MKKDGGPAFPCKGSIPDYANKRYVDVDYSGMSKRFYAACAAMQGILANPETSGNVTMPQIANKAFQYADALIEQEGKE